MASSLFRLDQKGLGVALGPLEHQVMEALWTLGRASKTAEVKEVLEQSGQTLSYSAIKAVLNNLTGKDWLTKTGVGNVTYFEPKRSREEAEQQVVSAVVASLKRNFGPPVIAEFVDQLADDPEALAEMERLLAAKRAEKRQ